MHERKGRVSTRLAEAAERRINRRRLVQGTSAAAAAFAATPLIGRRWSTAQEDVPREKSSATLDGPLQVLLKDDFHPDHNAFMRAELEAYAEVNGWEIEVTDVAGYQGAGDLTQRLLGSVQAGNPPDLLIHDQGVLNFHTLGLVEPVTDIMGEFIEAYGDPIPGARFDSTVEEEWWAVPFFTRSNGLFVRQDIFVDNGLDVIDDTDTYDKLRDAALQVSKPEENLWGWGMTVNRSGDGQGLVQNVMFRFGGHVQDESGQIVTLNSPETIAAFEWLKETYQDEMWAPMLPPGVLSWTDPNNNEAMLSGQTVITQNAGTVYAKAVLDEVPFADEIVLIPNPKRETDGVRIDFLSGGMKFYSIKGSKNQEASFDVMRHFLSQPVIERVWTISMGYALPAYTDGWENPIISENQNSLNAREIALTETGFTGLNWPGPDNAALASIASGVYFTDMMSEVLQGRPTEEVIEDYHEQFVQIYQDFGREGE
jgi:multiple sugar transport system substrate-binding protein